jgi:hypothetical protein
MSMEKFARDCKSFIKRFWVTNPEQQPTNPE